VSRRPLRIGWFSSGGGKGSRNLLTAVCSSIERGELNAEISFVFCSREQNEAPESDLFFELVGSYGIPLVCLSYRDFRKAHGGGKPTVGEPLPGWRLDYDRQAMELLEALDADVCVLAGYMLVVGEEMCRRYTMLNLHPAEPGGPTGAWRDVIWKLIDSRAARSGVMMHLVTPDLDKGPVVTYCTFPIKGGKWDRYWKELGGASVAEIKGRQGEAYTLFRLIRQHGAARELPFIVATLTAFAEGRVRVVGSEVIDSKGQKVGGYDLTVEVDEAVRGSL